MLGNIESLWGVDLMTKTEFDRSNFFGGMKGKVSGNWYRLITCDFQKRTITIDDGYGTVVPCHLIEELEKFTKEGHCPDYIVRDNIPDCKFYKEPKCKGDINRCHDK